jgi:hypothetical protein
MQIKRALKRLAFSLTPLLLLLIAAETVVRVKFFLLHKHDWNYITMPFRVQDQSRAVHAFYMPPKQPARDAPMQFAMYKPCRNSEAPSVRYGKPMPYTWDANCFRGDPMTPAKPAGEIRLFVLGGSTVQSYQPDVDMWTTRLKETIGHPRLRVVNAGQSSMESDGIASLFDAKIRLFAPDIVLYYEAWNEQVAYSQWNQVNRFIGSFSSAVHDTLYYHSAVYTYLVEKYAFGTKKAVQFWKIDVERLRGNLDRLSQDVRRSGARMVFVTQVIRFPRFWKGIDTFQPAAVEALLDRLKQDPAYAYDTYEVSALNQRLAVLRSVEFCRALDVPVIDILNEFEALGDAGRARLFVDLGHLTGEGDDLVGRLAGEKLKALGVVPEP